MMRSTLLALAFLLLSTNARAQSLPSTSAARSLADSVMQAVVAGDIEGAFARLEPYWPLPENELNALLSQTVEQRNAVAERFGTPIGYVMVDEEQVEDTLLRLTYLEKLGRHAIRWQFVFYKPRDSWIINSVRWDDQIQELF